MLLSIVVMMKNEEKYLEKTLIALKKLMSEINSELIILDTGSNDNSVNIARKYTDKVYFATWNNNFADMRNKSISYAKGDWILIVDADEEIIEYKNLISFFKSNLYKKYNSASIELKNINSEDYKSYTRAMNVRMFKNENFKYEGAIHEQPIYKRPIYNNIATFNHYGYLYIDEVQKMNKIKRNEKILLEEIKKNPDNPYINFQLAKNLMAIDKNKEAKYYMEKAFKLYKEQGSIPPYIYSNLATLYIVLSEYSKSEKICNEYIVFDDKNIDIYYYLAVTQSILYKYDESIFSYKRYLYLLENYNISTQYANIFCDGSTLSLREEAEIAICKNNYLLEQYTEVFNMIMKMKSEQVARVYNILFITLLKINKVDFLLEIYNKLKTETEKKRYRLELEKVLLNIRESEKIRIYTTLSNIHDNYGVLNKARLGYELGTEEIKTILVNENEEYYSDLVYYAFNKGIELKEILYKVRSVNIQRYFNYLCINKKDFLIDAYNYLLNEPLILNLNEIKIFSTLSGCIIKNSKLEKSKYFNLFLMYTTYQYEYIKKLCREDLNNEELMYLVNDIESMFILEFMNIQKIKEENPLQYIRGMKKLLVENPEYKKGIEIFIDKFEKEINEDEELKKLKAQYKLIIQESVNNGNLEACKNLIKDYEEMFEYEDLNNIKGILSLYMNDVSEAQKWFKLAYCSNRYDKDVLFNIDYIKKNF